MTETSNVAEAGRMAGYGRRQSAHHALKNIQKKMGDLLDEVGMDDKTLLTKYLQPGLDSTKIEFFSKDGIVMEEKVVIDRSERRHHLDMVWKLKGRYKQAEDNAGSQVRSNTNTVCVVVADERRAARLARLLSGSGPAGVVIDVDAEVDKNLA